MTIAFLIVAPLFTCTPLARARERVKNGTHSRSDAWCSKKCV